MTDNINPVNLINNIGLFIFLIGWQLLIL